MKFIDVCVVRGSSGPSLQICGPAGGTRISGPKAWGNPLNRPIYEFTVAVDELIAAIKGDAYDEPEDTTDG